LSEEMLAMMVRGLDYLTEEEAQEFMRHIRERQNKPRGPKPKNPLPQVMAAYAVVYAVEQDAKKTGKKITEVFKDLPPLVVFEDLVLTTERQVREAYYDGKRWAEANGVEFDRRDEEKKQLIGDWVRRVSALFRP
jgi:hypothetical protein